MIVKLVAIIVFICVLGSCASDSDRGRSHYEYQKAINENFISRSAPSSETSPAFLSRQINIGSSYALACERPSKCIPDIQVTLTSQLNYNNPGTGGIANISQIEFEAIKRGLTQLMQGLGEGLRVDNGAVSGISQTDLFIYRNQYLVDTIRLNTNYAQGIASIDVPDNLIDKMSRLPFDNLTYEFNVNLMPADPRRAIAIEIFKTPDATDVVKRHTISNGQTLCDLVNSRPARDIYPACSE